MHTGPSVSGDSVYVAQAGPVGHAPEDGKVVISDVGSIEATNVAAGAPCLRMWSSAHAQKPVSPAPIASAPLATNAGRPACGRCGEIRTAAWIQVGCMSVRAHRSTGDTRTGRLAFLRLARR